MRAVSQLIDHLYEAGRLTDSQLAELRQMGLTHIWVRSPFGSIDADVHADDHDDDLGRIDAWDAHGDQLTEQARPRRNRRPHSPRRSSAPAPDLFDALRQAVAAAEPLVAAAFEVARRLKPTVQQQNSLHEVKEAAAVDLDDTIARDDLWARLWPLVSSEPLVFSQSHHSSSVNRRFLSLIAGRHSGMPLARGVAANPMVRQAADIWEVHHQLAAAVGRVAHALDPVRVLRELNLAGDPVTYEVMTLLHSARAPRRTIATLPTLDPSIGVPTVMLLPSEAYRPERPAWEIAARLDPMAVLPYLDWCLRGWAAPAIDTRPAPQSPRWFCIAQLDVLREKVIEATMWNDEPRQKANFHIALDDGTVYRRGFPLRGFDWSPKWSDPTHRNPPIRLLWSEGVTSDKARAEWGRLWLANRWASPLLTCPKEWESPFVAAHQLRR